MKDKLHRNPPKTLDFDLTPSFPEISGHYFISLPLQNLPGVNLGSHEAAKVQKLYLIKGLYIILYMTWSYSTTCQWFKLWKPPFWTRGIGFLCISAPGLLEGSHVRILVHRKNLYVSVYHLKVRHRNSITPLLDYPLHICWRRKTLLLLFAKHLWLSLYSERSYRAQVWRYVKSYHHQVIIMFFQFEFLIRFFVNTTYIYIYIKNLSCIKNLCCVND